jgi:hypothetical protein
MPTLQAAVTTNRTTLSDPVGLTTSVVVAAGNRRALVACVAGEGDGSATQAEVTGIARDGQAMTRIARAERADWSWAEIWILVAPNTGTSNAVISLSEGDCHTVGFYIYDDVNQAGPNRTGVTATGSATSGTVTVGSVAATDVVIDCLCIDAIGHNPVEDAGQTEQYELDASAASETASSVQAGSDGGVMSWTWTTSAPFSLVATALIHDDGGAAATAPKRLSMLGVG